MRKVLFALFVVILFFTIYQVLTPILSANPDFSSLVVRDVLVVSLLIAALSLVISLVALLRASRVEKQIEDRLVAIDRALSDFANRADVAALSMADLARATHRDIMTMQKQLATDEDAGLPPSPPEAGGTKTQPGKIVPIKIEQSATPSRPDTDAGTLREMIETGQGRLSLLPIVDVIEMTPMAFEAYASLRAGDQTIDIQRADHLPDSVQSRLSQLLLARSIEAARQFDRKEGEQHGHPIHVAVSGSFLRAAKERSVEDLVGTGDRALPDGLILSVSLDDILEQAPPYFADDWRPLLACEADSFPESDIRALAEADIRWLKLSAKAILSEPDSERYGFICGPLGMDIIVTHVHGEEDAVALLDRGFRYMSGHHFGIPRPLRRQVPPGEAGSS
ncbi:hypothetical protein [Notoacmeibacter ruber]|uniref:EAL domain-containing protein n=1 Tax=Notoacmeibacter ruber TaxID=2670375 RepID=A0A3L7J964_9HYPH|nr:hypothetical protein [Notoacmeibacter ruber]RLQ87268.1 hypothetical protein D8780_02615 [Notoacmeibacter ruber]